MGEREGGGEGGWGRGRVEEGECDGLEIKAVNGLALLVICEHIIPRHAPTASRDCFLGQLEA